MALPGTDPYKDSAPVITAHSYDQSFYGEIFTVKLTGTFMHALASILVTNYPSETLEYDGILYGAESSSVSSFTGKFQSYYTKIDGRDSGDLPSHRLYFTNPLCYTKANPARIILAVAHWHCDIIEAKIDVTSFDDLATWATGNSFLRSVWFLEDTCLNILKKMMEATGGMYIYINGALKLTCDYLNHEPSSADYDLTDDDIVEFIEYSSLYDRPTPSILRWGHDVRGWQEPGTTIFPLYRKTVDPPSGTLALEKEYMIPSLDGGTSDNGNYIYFNQYVLLKIAVGTIGHAVDIGESVKITSLSLGLSQDSSYDDNFVIHGVEIDLQDGRTILWLVKKTTW